MKIHIIFAHPHIQSFNGSLRNQAIHTLRELGHEVSYVDLYQEKFKASADENDFTNLFNPDYFDIQVEQIKALELGTFTEDIKREQKILKESQCIILQFPLWWYSMPALLKGYIDRVFSMGFAYGRGNALAGKKVLVSMTTGAPEKAWSENDRGEIKEIFKHLFVGTFGLCQMEAFEPFIAYGVKRLNEEERNQVIMDYDHYLRTLFS